MNEEKNPDIYKETIGPMNVPIIPRTNKEQPKEPIEGLQINAELNEEYLKELDDLQTEYANLRVQMEDLIGSYNDLSNELEDANIDRQRAEEINLQLESINKLAQATKSEINRINTDFYDKNEALRIFVGISKNSELTQN